jgi:dolichol-phosphate mannosyltransferase
MKVLIMIPTYNEIGNVPSLIECLLKLKKDILFVDDNSPDGTGKLLDEYSDKYDCIKVIHREGKLGIGTAHQRGIEYAYENNYTHLVTMDGDMTHPVKDIPRMISYANNYNIVIAGRHSNNESIKEWELYRQVITIGAHQLTLYFLHLPYDATTAFRIYRIDVIPLSTFKLVQSKGYSFFIESLCILNENKFTIYDIPSIHPTRLSGKSKLKMKDMMYWAYVVLKLGIQIRLHYHKIYDRSLHEL